MAFDGFIKFSEIEGESSDAKHQGWIEISDCGMEILQNVSTTASSAGGATAERADLSDFKFTKLMDKSSPLLALACAEGEAFDTVTVELCRAGSEKVKFMEFKLTNSISRFDLAYWYGDRYNYEKFIRQFDPLTEEMFRKQGVEETYLLARLVEGLKDAGAAVGTDEVITSMASAGAVAGQATLSTINALFRQIYDDAAKQFGRKAAASMKKANLARMAGFMKAHPAYPKLMQQLKEMPRAMLPVSRSALVGQSSSTVDAIAQARYFNKNCGIGTPTSIWDPLPGS